MKRNLVFIVIVSCFMVLLVGSSVLAGSFYVDYMPGSWEEKFTDEGDTFKTDDDTSGAIVGFEQNFDKFKIDIEYTDSKFKKYDYAGFSYDDVDYFKYVDYDYTGFDLKFGYQISDQLAFMLGYRKYKLEPQKRSATVSAEGITQTDYFYDYTVDGMVLGLDVNFPIANKISIIGSLEYSIDGKYKCELFDESDSMDTDIITAKIKFNFELIDSLDLSIGYRYTEYELDDDSNSKIKFSGPTAGLTYRFSGSSYTKDKSSNDQPGTKTLTLINDFHGTEYTLTVNHAGTVKVGDVINLTAEQVKEIKKTLCGDYPSFYDGELGIRETVWHKLDNKEVKVKELVMYDSNKQIVGASLTITEVR